MITRRNLLATAGVATIAAAVSHQSVRGQTPEASPTADGITLDWYEIWDASDSFSYVMVGGQLTNRTNQAAVQPGIAIQALDASGAELFDVWPAGDIVFLEPGASIPLRGHPLMFGGKAADVASTVITMCRAEDDLLFSATLDLSKYTATLDSAQMIVPWDWQVAGSLVLAADASQERSGLEVIVRTADGETVFAEEVGMQPIPAPGQTSMFNERIGITIDEVAPRHRNLDPATFGFETAVITRDLPPSCA